MYVNYKFNPLKSMLNWDIRHSLSKILEKNVDLVLLTVRVDVWVVGGTE